jgi:hypothetical protein
MTGVWLAIVGLALLAVAEAVAILALAREVGVLSKRLPPAPALESLEGPEPGTSLPSHRLRSLADGKERALDAPSATRKVLIFMSTRCRLCADLLADLDGVARDWPDHEIVPILAGPHREAAEMVSRSGFTGPAWQDDGAAMRAVNIITTPRALVVGKDGTVVARGVVNNREMVSSLIQGRLREGEGALWVEGDTLYPA